jgi:hydrogenase maturation protease
MAPVLIIGLGNDCRGDDAVGLLAARELRGSSRGRFAVCEHQGDGLALLDLWDTRGVVILIDAVRSGSNPGTIHRFDATTKMLPSAAWSQSTHAFGVGEAIELARALKRLPSRLIVYGIESRNFTAGSAVSPAVERAIPKVVRRVFTAATKSDWLRAARMLPGGKG